VIARLDTFARASDALHCAMFALDSQDFTALRDAFTPDATIAWPDVVEGLAERAALADALAARGAGARTHHQVTNLTLESLVGSVRITGLLAARWRRPTLRGADGCANFSTLEAELREHAASWRIARLVVTRGWIEGNPGVLEPAPETAELPAPRPRAPLPSEPMPPDKAARLRRLEDRDAILALMHRFGAALDAKDWSAYGACFADRVTIDFSETTGRPPATVRSQDFVAFAKARQRGHAAYHQYSNFQCAILGDEATIRLYLVARHRAPDASGDALNVFVGWYENGFVRTSDGWRLSRLGHPLQWVEGNAAIKDGPDPEADALGRHLFSREDA
jgi:hypothetical protein